MIGRAHGNPRSANRACAVTHDAARPSSSRTFTTTSRPVANRSPNTAEIDRAPNSTATGLPPR
ncbi:hypothetical protein LCL61_37330 [Amycolatopsis coloradensis]|uniref:Uncharacterized protein n=1 Tax=Amycolatopsis coloradensis TaxID=76021 RepID=A0ACD5BPH5_9PSEU